MSKYEARNCVITTGFPYFNSEDVRKIYEFLNGKPNGSYAFTQKAQLEIAEKTKKGFNVYYQFKDEDALFDLFKERFSNLFEQKKIYCWSDLMQYIS